MVVVLLLRVRALLLLLLRVLPVLLRVLLVLLGVLPQALLVLLVGWLVGRLVAALHALPRCRGGILFIAPAPAHAALLPVTLRCVLACCWRF